MASIPFAQSGLAAANNPSAWTTTTVSGNGVAGVSYPSPPNGLPSQAAPPLTNEEREEIYDILGQLAALGHDQAVTILKTLLRACDKSEGRIRVLEEALRAATQTRTVTAPYYANPNPFGTAPVPYNPPITTPGVAPGGGQWTYTDTTLLNEELKEYQKSVTSQTSWDEIKQKFKSLL